MLRITAVWTAPYGSPYYSTFYFGGDTSGEADAASAAVAAFLGVMDGNIASTYTWNIDQQAEFVDEVTGNVTGVESVPAGNGTGSGSGDPLPTATQALIRWRTNTYLNGREIRGRTFFPGFVETASTAGKVTTGLLSGLNTAAANFITGSSGAGNLVIWSPTHGQSATVLTGTAWDEFAVLRSRRS